MEVSYSSLFIYQDSPILFPTLLSTGAWVWGAAPRPVSFRPTGLNETERVVSERGRKELPPGTKGGENLKPDRHYEHKQHAFDSYCKKVLKYEAYNGYREISRRQKYEALFSELSEEELAQLAVYDRYSWEYTAFPVGGAVILIEDDRLAEALNALPQDNRDIFLMYWFLDMADREIAEYMNMARRTVNTRRQKAYRLLKELMGGEADD